MIALMQTFAFGNGPDNEGCAERLAEFGLVCRRPGAKEFEMTARGEKYVDMILSTPLPIEAWIDPRDRDDEAT